MRVYIVEDNESMRIILKRMLRKNFPSIEKINECDNAEQALVEIPDYRPNLVLVDISLPGMDGIELIRILKPKCKFICILVVTGHEVELYRPAALEAGADDIISKSEGEKLISAVRSLMENRDRQCK